MQHLISSYRGEDVEDEVSNENLLHRNPEGDDVGSVAGKARRYTILPSSLSATITRFEGFWLRPAASAQRKECAQIGCCRFRNARKSPVGSSPVARCARSLCQCVVHHPPSVERSG